MFSDEVLNAMRAGDEMRNLLRRVAEIDATVGWQARFWAKVDVCGPDDCWNWMHAKSEFGHGNFKAGGRKSAHRTAYKLVHGEIPANACVCHSCDNPGCCNPRHLWLGSKADNNRDSWVKGRRTMPPPPTGELHARGERIGTAKLTADMVRQIIASNLSQSALARQFGVSTTAIRNVQKGRTWSHVSGTTAPVHINTTI